ncbi:hypothetical protein BDW02DRAFT_598686 [Decorospora gaudefroyi]|uniref:Uncharacterized protein n=1 Tax=Decorospora gaudefroyi TaxID=184978 RepID=A0A6A5KC59_9PLEO|nr:hypothetical protein BDW02DRAFT_598686 [Decorospora gaudefroyi]
MASPQIGNGGRPASYTEPHRFPPGARCITCGEIYDEENVDQIDLCPRHRGNGEEQRLASVSLELRGRLLFKCMAVRERLGWPHVDSYKDVPLRSSAEAQWWRWTTAFHYMCEFSHEALEAPLQNENLKVHEVRKLRFLTKAEHGPMVQCAFLIMAQPGIYVFDPTGVQFGPDWPVLSRVETYRAERMDSKYVHLAKVRRLESE